MFLVHAGGWVGRCEAARVSVRPGVLGFAALHRRVVPCWLDHINTWTVSNWLVLT